MTVFRDFGDGLVWRKSSRSNENGGACLYAAASGETVGVRDSKLGPGGPVLRLDRSDWASLTKAVAR